MTSTMRTILMPRMGMIHAHNRSFTKQAVSILHSILLLLGIALTLGDITGLSRSVYAGESSSTHWAKPEEIASTTSALKSFFKGAEVRYPGSPGNLAMEKKVADCFNGSGFPDHGEIRFRSATFVPGQASLQAEGLALMRMFPLHPTMIRPGNFSEQKFKANLIYLGRGAIDDLAAVKGLDLNNAIAVMDFDCGDNWSRLLRFGLKGIIFCGSRDYEYSDAVGKVYFSEASFPRYFISYEDGERLKKSLTNIPATPAQSSRLALPAQIDAEPSRIQNTNLRNLWVYIEGSDPALSKEVLVITAPMDANCVVPELAEGGQNGGNLFLLVKLLQSFTKDRPVRSVLLVALNAHTSSFQGERMLSWHLLAKQNDIEGVRNLMVQDIRLQEMYVSRYTHLLESLTNPAQSNQAEELLIEFRSLKDESTGKKITVKEKLVSLIRSDVNKFKTERLELYRNLKKQGQSEDQARSNIATLKQKHEKYVTLLKLFNKWGQSKRYSDLSAEERTLLTNYVTTVLKENTQSAELNKRDLAIDQSNKAIRDALKGRSVKVVINLALTFMNRQTGFWSGSFFDKSEWCRVFGAKCAEVSQTLKEVKEGHANLFTDTLTFRGSLPEGYYYPNDNALRYFHFAEKTPALSLKNVFTHYGKLFTPGDTFTALNKENVAELSNYVPTLLRAISSTDMSGLKPVPLRDTTWSIQIRTLKFDEFSAVVMPDVPVCDSVITIQPFVSLPNIPLPILGDATQSHVYMTDSRALAYVYSMCDTQPLPSTGMQFNADFTKVLHVIDGGEKELTTSSNVLKKNTQTFVMFPCDEFPIYQREDPSRIGSLQVRITEITPLDARRETRPRQLGMAGLLGASDKRYLPTAHGPVSIFTNGRHPVKFLTRSNLAVINTTPQYPEGEGFTRSSEMSSDLLFNGSRDQKTLSESRLSKMKGVSQELPLQFLKESGAAFEKAETCLKAHDHVGYIQSLYTSLGAGRQAYEQVTYLTNDMLRAVIFYMALIIPFCFFMQKLLFNFTRIEAQLMGFLGLFMGCYIAFRNIHPAFEVAKSPEGLLIAFIMGSLGLFVIKILHGRFEGEMQMLFRNQAGASVEIGFSTVGQKAMLIGVNNMRRRRVRTILTTATIVLVTFTMLSFTSISSQMSPTIVALNRPSPPYTGFMYHQPGTRMDESTMKIFQEIFHGRADVIVRRWLLPVAFNKTTIPMYLGTSTGETAKLDGVLGLSKAEDGFLDTIPLSAGRYFSSDDADEVVLPNSLAQTLGITPQTLADAKVTFMGRELTVVGILDDQKFRSMSDLDGFQLLPQKETSAKASGSGEVVSGGATGVQVQGAEQTGFYVDLNSMMILPLEKSLKCGALPYSVSIRFKDKNTPLWPEVTNLLSVTNAKFFIGNQEDFVAGLSEPATKTPNEKSPSSEKQTVGPVMKPGVYFVGAGFKTSFGNLSSLIIPLLISGTIILNTMLGSVYERKREIAIYNAVGLNPNHIGMFFLSEAFVYSVVGSVGGYMIGQVLSIVLIQLGVVGIDLNFSSLKVVYVILFTIAMVLLSTLYPAIVATRAAVPSGKRKWEIPDHDGQTMQIVFPFIYQKGVVRGVMNYLEAYFERFTEASLGDLIASPENRTLTQDADGHEVLTLQYNVALAPFDLGVTQRAILVCAWDNHVQCHRVTLSIQRLSGQDTNWVTTNKPFLERLRAYLMQWRNMTAEQQAVYIQVGVPESSTAENNTSAESDPMGATVVLPG